MSILKKVPGIFLFVILTIIYLFCGYIFGYHQGYKAGQIDYNNYLNEVLEK